MVVHLGARLVALGLTILTFAIASPAAAHPLVDEGRARYDSADFRGSLEVLARAEGASNLTRDDLLELLELRALVHQALGDRIGVDGDLRALVSVAPDHSFSPEVPPDITERFAELRSATGDGIRVAVAPQEIPGGVALEARVDGDVGGVVRHVRVRGRADGSWQTAQNRPLELMAADGTRVVYYAEAIGPGGAIVASSGSASAPEAHVVGGAFALGDEDDEDDETSGVPWLWIGVGAGAVALAIVVTVLATSGGEEARTQIVGPVGPWPEM